MGTRRLSGTIKDAFYRIERKRLVKTRNTWTSPLLSYSYPLPFLDYKLRRRVEKRFVIQSWPSPSVSHLFTNIYHTFTWFWYSVRRGSLMKSLLRSASRLGDYFQK